MRPQKISRDELLERCSQVFRRNGYHGTTMDALASACDLTKASFYHHYSNKEALAVDVVSWAHAHIARTLFALAYDDTVAVDIRFQEMARKAKRLFKEGTVGCLMAVMSIDAAYSIPALMTEIRAFLTAWATALAHLFSDSMSKAAAMKKGQQIVSDYEGAILMSRVYDDFNCFDRVTKRVLKNLSVAEPHSG